MPDLNNVIFSHSKISTCQQNQINELKQLALSHPQKCARLCLHSDNQASIQQMLLVIHKDCRFHPHKHPHKKSESIHIIEGRVGFSFFNDCGEVIERHVMQPNDVFIIRLEGDTWHLPIVISEWAVFHEIYTGPYDKSKDVIVAPWFKGGDRELEALYQTLQANFGGVSEE